MVRLIPLVILALVAAACGGAPASSPKPATPKPASGSKPATSSTAPAKASAPSLKTVTVMMNYRPRGYQAPFYVALEKGFYKAAGLNVKLEANTAAGASLPLQLVANGKVTFGVTAATLMPKAVKKGIDVRFVGLYIQENPLSFVYLAGEHLSSPAKLVGKRIGDVAGSSGLSLMPAFLRRNHVKPSSIHLVLMSASALPTALLQHKIDTYDTFNISSVPVLSSKGAHPKALIWANWGFVTLGYGIVASNRTIQQRPAVVRAFLKATAQGYQYSLSHPQQAINMMAAVVGKSLMPANKPALQQLTLSLAMLHTKASKGHPIGWMAKSDWVSTVQLISRAEKIKASKNVGLYYTDRFFGSSS